MSRFKVLVRTIVLCLTLLCVSTSQLFAQSSKKDGLSGHLPFTDVLSFLEEKFEVAFSYNASLLAPLSVDTTLKVSTLQQALSFLEETFPVSIEETTPGNYLVVPVRQDVRFALIDKETGKSIPYASLKVNKGDELLVFARKDSITLTNVFVLDSVGIHSPFYRSRNLLVSDLLKSRVAYLEVVQIQLSQVTVSSYITTGIDLSMQDQSLNIDMEKLALLAGETDGDIFNLVKTMPGIQTPDGKPGSLSIRNSTFDQSALFFDDIPIYHTGHFFGTISPFNPQAVKSVKVQRGTLTSEWGGRVGGLISLSTPDQVQDSLRWGVIANTLYGGANVELPVVRNRLSISLSARASHPFAIYSPKMDAYSRLNFQGSKLSAAILNDVARLNEYDVGFSDINGKLSARINQRNRLHLSFIRIGDQFSAEIESEEKEELSRQEAHLLNQGVNLRWKSQLSAKWVATTSLSTSMLNIEESNHERQRNRDRKDERSINKIGDYRARFTLDYFRNAHSAWKLGYLYNHTYNSYQEYNFGVIDKRNETGYAITHSLYVQSKEALGKRWMLNMGLRADHHVPFNQTFLDPRLLVSYKTGKKSLLKGSLGRSHQYAMRLFVDDFNDFRVANQFWDLADNRTPILTGHIATLGGVVQKGSWTFDLEGYAKRTLGMVWEVEPGNEVGGEMNSVGADLFVKKSWKNCETWASYTVSHTRTHFDSLSTAYFDQTHALNAVFLYRWKRWNASLAWSYLSGMPLIVPELDPNHQNSQGQTTLQVPYTHRFPPQHQLDASLTWKFWKKEETWRGVVGLSAQNLYNRKNIINIFQTTPSVNQPYRYAVGFAPNLTLRLNF